MSDEDNVVEKIAHEIACWFPGFSPGRYINSARRIAALNSSPSFNTGVDRLKAILAEMRDIRHGVSGLSVPQVDDWYAERADEALVELAALSDQSFSHGGDV